MYRYTFDWQENDGYEKAMINRETSDKPQFKVEIRQSENEFEKGKRLSNMLKWKKNK